jgi:threonyl-tRNA synthetase
MFPEINKNNETLYLRPMTCPHHCVIYKQKPRSYRDLPFRLCENSILHRYESSGGLKGLERPRYFELADHHIFVSKKLLKQEIKKNCQYIIDILKVFNFETQLVCAFNDSNDSEKYHPDQQV